jgi:hypothetical protein
MRMHSDVEVEKRRKLDVYAHRMHRECPPKKKKTLGVPSACQRRESPREHRDQREKKWDIGGIIGKTADQTPNTKHQTPNTKQAQAWAVKK